MVVRAAVPKVFVLDMVFTTVVVPATAVVPMAVAWVVAVGTRVFVETVPIGVADDTGTTATELSALHWARVFPFGQHLWPSMQ